ncbi:MAG: methyl-accepting chemotaxis protein [Candidatus Omnitrophica bacterium]|nr:methyl-accepting chemotaxis protein [Candidatus Omnitrophota bacterium]MBU1853074.1 methyl-accepting chemotaxis protein [Candidatus Omnitrophota bacterium]
MKTRRRKYFINKGFQSEFILKFCGLVALGGVIFGVILYIFSSRTLTTSFENSRLVVKSTADYLLPGLLFGGIVVGLLTAVATSIVVLFMTHRLAGPVYRFEKYIKDIGLGDFSQDLKIRKKDQFQDMANSFNKMTNDVRAQLLKIVELSEKLDGLIEELSSVSRSDMPLKEDIERTVSELRKDRQDLKRVIAFFKV